MISARLLIARLVACLAAATLVFPILAFSKPPAPAVKAEPKPSPAKPALKPAVPAQPSTTGPTEKVGKSSIPNRWVTPANQVITPAGLSVDLYGLRPQALALSPDGRLLVTAGRTAELIVIDPANGKILQKVTLPAEKPADLKVTGAPAGIQQKGVLGPESASPATKPNPDTNTTP